MHKNLIQEIDVFARSKNNFGHKCTCLDEILNKWDDSEEDCERDISCN